MFKLLLKKKLAVMLFAGTGLFSLVGINQAVAEQPTLSANTSSAKANIENFDEAALKAKLKQTLGLNVELISATPLPNIVLIVTDQGQFYATTDGQFFIQGKVYQVTDKVVNLADASLAKIRLEGVARFEKDMIVFPAENEKHVVTVFTDITCGYCRKLHSQMADYNAKGITIRYLPYPRSGVFDQSGGFTQGFQDLRSIWCNEDPKAALTKAKTGTGVAHRICDKPVKEAFQFGVQIGVNGTPAIILEDGSMLPGYQDPDKLAKVLDQL